jgi:hypothetical protein
MLLLLRPTGDGQGTQSLVCGRWIDDSKLFKKWQSQIHTVNILPLVMLKTWNKSTTISAQA